MTSLLFLIFTLHLASADSHSLDYFFTGVTPGISCPEFTVVGHVDGLQGGYFDSNSERVTLTGEWLKDNKDEEHWNKITEISQFYQIDFKVCIATAMQLFNHSEGIHTWQFMVGCELHDDGTKRGYSRYGYDGKDWLTLDLNTLTWTAANDKAVITKQEENTAKAKGHKNFLETECIQWLQKYVKFGRETLERKVPPEGSLFQKDCSSPVVCHATGFFPKAVMISWQKNGEVLHEDVELRETLPNQDGTFQKRSVLTVTPEELDKNEYTCIIQHSGLEKELVLLVSDLRVSGGVLIGIIVGAVVSVLLVIICVGVLVWMKKQQPSASQVPTDVWKPPECDRDGEADDE
ncbi:RLA class I histocompatibility antigen, alpha chain 11/11-like isoform X2 [Colossoma macropomum]|uniref:RLA class I histocompatibility antigen, alpha chain 11/11-like isoform X2 n=1 Tax=Colossoma macropomum TaxID=42526 RepID=UPI0018646C71|nr:RLA class I histocompatibility antigen, alpha chain 11/11-like isoform X2 [Colossoma macropomum]